MSVMLMILVTLVMVNMPGEVLRVRMVVMLVGLVQVYSSRNLGMFQQEESTTTGKM